MASSLREQHDWLAEDRATEAKDRAAFGAPAMPTDPAVSDNTIKPVETVRPVEFLVSVKDELTDSRTWLERQFAAIQAEHARRELEEQHERQESAAASEAVISDVSIGEEPEHDPEPTDRRAPRAEPILAAVLYLRSLYRPYLAKLR
ncbi:MAG: hypothetical protein ACOYB4_05840, partial [Methyloceanibacter sp.]